jgi:hypothetical protein
MSRGAIGIFMLAMIALFAFHRAQGQGAILYRSFEQVTGERRNPAIPEDGIIISSLPLARFPVAPHSAGTSRANRGPCTIA